MFDTKVIAERLRMVSFGNYIQPTGVVNRFTFPAIILQIIKDTHLKKIPPYRDRGLKAN